MTLQRVGARSHFPPPLPECYSAVLSERPDMILYDYCLILPEMNAYPATNSLRGAASAAASASSSVGCANMKAWGAA